eukprot:ctg_840.g196
MTPETAPSRGARTSNNSDETENADTSTCHANSAADRGGAALRIGAGCRVDGKNRVRCRKDLSVESMEVRGRTRPTVCTSSSKIPAPGQSHFGGNEQGSGGVSSVGFTFDGTSTAGSAPCPRIRNSPQCRSEAYAARFRCAPRRTSKNGLARTEGNRRDAVADAIRSSARARTDSRRHSFPAGPLRQARGVARQARTGGSRRRSPPTTCSPGNASAARASSASRTRHSGRSEGPAGTGTDPAARNGSSLCGTANWCLARETTPWGADIGR